MSTVTNDTHSDDTQAASEDEHAGSIDSFLQEIGCTIWNSLTLGQLSKLERCGTRGEITRIDRPKTIGIPDPPFETCPKKVKIGSSKFRDLCCGETTKLLPAKTRKLLPAKEKSNLEGDKRHVLDTFKNFLRLHGPTEAMRIVNLALPELRQISTTNEGGLVSGQAAVVHGQEDGLPRPGFNYGNRGPEKDVEENMMECVSFNECIATCSTRMYLIGNFTTEATGQRRKE